MWCFFFGFLFIFAEYPLSISASGTVDLLPSAVGFALLFLGAQELRKENEHFRRVRIISIPAIVIGAAHFAFALIGYAIVEKVLVILTIAAGLYFAYEFTEGVKKIERSRYKKLGADKLASAWIILCMTSILGFLVKFFPSVALPQLVVHLLAVIWFESSVFQIARAIKKR